jgi:hypothetical protein
MRRVRARCEWRRSALLKIGVLRLSTGIPVFCKDSTRVLQGITPGFPHGSLWSCAKVLKYLASTVQALAGENQAPPSSAGLFR